MPLYTDTTSNTVHEYDPATFGEKLLANLIACGVLVEGDQTGSGASQPEPSLEQLTAAELRARADELGVDVPARATKADIVAAIEAAQAADTDDTPDTDSAAGDAEGDPADEGDEG